MQPLPALRIRTRSSALSIAPLRAQIRGVQAAAQRRPPPEEDVEEQHAPQAQQPLTGAAKLMAEAEEEEREIARLGGRRYVPRSDVAADDSPAWTGDESVRDAVIRLLMDKHKPLRSGTVQSADSRIHELVAGIDVSPRVHPSGEPEVPAARPTAAHILREREIAPEDFKPWHARYVRTASAEPSVHFGKFMESAAGRRGSGIVSLLDRPALPNDPAARRAEKARRRAEERASRMEGAKEGALEYRLGGGEGYQAKGSSAAGGGVRGRPSGMRAWGNLVEDRIERARSAGWFNEVKGRGKPINTDPDLNNPHIDRSEFFMNRIVKRQGAKPPWIELLGELESSQASFRASLLSSYTRALLRSLLTSPYHDRSSLSALSAGDVTRLRDDGWRTREEAYHKEAVRQLNDLVRRMNALAPPVVRRGLVTLDEELGVMYDQAGPIVVAELAKRRHEDWDKVKGVSEYDEDVLGAGKGGAAGGEWKDAWTFGEVLRRFSRGLSRLFDTPTTQDVRQTDRHRS